MSAMTMVQALNSAMAVMLERDPAVVLLGEAFTPAHAVGTALVVGGVGYHTWREMKAPVRT